ncbi:MAG TPA: hypothetical protein PK771_11475, partial [Spirochaetota bacterium]|nr:hypothetical protein [Spirochaetota bacterium]
ERILDENASLTKYIDDKKQSNFKIYNNDMFKEADIVLGNDNIKVSAKMDKNIFLFTNENTIELLVLTNSKIYDDKLTKHIFEPFLMGLSVLIEKEKFDIKEEQINLNITILYKDKTSPVNYNYKIDLSYAKEYLLKLVNYYFDKKLFYEPDFKTINSLIKKLEKTDEKWKDENFTLEKVLALQEKEKSSNELDITELIKMELPENYFEIVKDKYDIFYKFLT